MTERIRVLVVDDSTFVRNVVSKAIDSDPEIEVVGTAMDGIDAIEKTKSLTPDVITMDITMPRMDGITALRHIMSDCPTPVVMLSALTGEQTKATIEALELGAVDFFLKPSQLRQAGGDGIAEELIAKVKLASKVNRLQLKVEARSRVDKRVSQPKVAPASSMDRVIVVGSSTGGPQSLSKFIPELPGDIPAGILIVQHMPPGFTKSLAERLDGISAIRVKEAEPGDILIPGLAILAPGGYHMTVTRSGKVSLNQGPQIHGVRPSVDVTMESAVKSYGSSTMAVVLTGMGIDGTHGAGLIKSAGGKVLVEDESTCIVYGMPKSIVDAGYADAVLPLHQMAERVRSTMRKPQAVG